MTGTVCHSWIESYGVSADQLFPLLVKTTCAIDNWEVVRADETRRIIQMSVVNPGQAAEITLIIAYDADSISTLQLILQTKEPVDQEVAVENYPIKKILDLTGSGLVLKDFEHVPGDYSYVRVLSKRIASRQSVSKPHAKKSRRKLKPSPIADNVALINKLVRVGRAD